MLPLFDKEKKAIIKSLPEDGIVLMKFDKARFKNMKITDSYSNFKPCPKVKLHLKLNVLSTEFINKKEINEMILLCEKGALKIKDEEFEQIRGILFRLPNEDIFMYHEKFFTEFLNLFVLVKRQQAASTLFSCILYLIEFFNRNNDD